MSQDSHGTTLEHTGPAIAAEYYPVYSEKEIVTTPLYSLEVYTGSALILISMCLLGLPLTEGNYAAHDMGVSFTVPIILVIVDLVVFLVGLGMCMYGFRKHRREDAHH